MSEHHHDRDANPNHKKIVWVMMGGPSLEHDVSVVSGTGMVRNLDFNKYKILPIYVDRQGVWFWARHALTGFQQENFSKNFFLEETLVKSARYPSKTEILPCDVALLAFHGEFGEDGRIQAHLDQWNVAYTGSGLEASALAMNKINSKAVYKLYDIPTPPSVIIRRDQLADRLPLCFDQFGFPLVLKNPVGGSSFGISIVQSPDEALKAAEELFKDCNRILVEKFISGREASVGYIQGQAPMPVTEIRFGDKLYFDYEAKYLGKSEEITPGPFSEEITRNMQRLSREAHEALGLSGYSRTDFRIDQDDNLWVLESNSLPGFTPTSILPQQCAHLGIGYSQLLDIILNIALLKNG
jgi:D-alanine-D-alanine ligase